jgi:hypothetical protein
VSAAIANLALGDEEIFSAIIRTVEEDEAWLKGDSRRWGDGLPLRAGVFGVFRLGGDVVLS